MWQFPASPCVFMVLVVCAVMFVSLALSVDAGETFVKDAHAHEGLTRNAQRQQFFESNVGISRKGSGNKVAFAPDASVLAAGVVTDLGTVAVQLEAPQRGTPPSEPVDVGVRHTKASLASIKRASSGVAMPVLDVTTFGARGDGKTDSTEAFRQALAQVKTSGGGTIRVPAGTFRSAPLELTSNMVLYLERGATLQAIDSFELYRVVEPLESYGTGREGRSRGRRIAFLYGTHLRNVTITGDGGCIDGNGHKWWHAKWSSGTFDGITLPHLVEMLHTNGFELSNLRLVNSPMWTVHPFACRGVVIKRVEIVNPVHIHNTDGVDPDSCEDVLVEDVVYTGGDDGIAIKSGWDCYGDDRGFNRPTANVVVRNFTVRNTAAAAIAIGSEMSGGVANVLIDGLRVERAGAGGALCVKTTAARGGYVRNITVRNLQLGDVTGDRQQVAGVMVAGHVGGWVPEANPACPKKQRLPDISGLSIVGARQLPGTAIHGKALRLEGLQEGQVLRDVTFRDIQLRSTEHDAVFCSNAVITLDGGVSFSDLALGSQKELALSGWRKSSSCKVQRG